MIKSVLISFFFCFFNEDAGMSNARFNWTGGQLGKRQKIKVELCCFLKISSSSFILSLLYITGTFKKRNQLQMHMYTTAIQALTLGCPTEQMALVWGEGTFKYINVYIYIKVLIHFPLMRFSAHAFQIECRDTGGTVNGQLSNFWSCWWSLIHHSHFK